MKNGMINVVGIRCKPESESEFIKWYNEVHIPLILKFKGVTKAHSYKITKPERNYPEYLGIFEFESEEAFKAYEKSPELAAARDEKEAAWRNGGWEIMWRIQYKSLKTWTK